MTDPFSRYQTKGLAYEPKNPPSPLGAELQEPESITVQHHAIGVEAPETEFQRELRELLNKHSKENGSGTPDFILAEFLEKILGVFDSTVQRRANWRDERLDKVFDVKYDEKIKISVYDEHGRKNEIGEAEISIWPGETAAHGRIVGLKAIFEDKKDPSTNA